MLLIHLQSLTNGVKSIVKVRLSKLSLRDALIFRFYLDSLVFKLNEDDIEEDLMTLSRFGGNKALARRAANHLKNAHATGQPPFVPASGYAHNASSASASQGLFTRQQAALNGDLGGAERMFDAKIDSSTRRLYYEKRWFSEGQSVFIDNKQAEGTRESRKAGTIMSVMGSEVVVKVQGSTQKLRISVRQLNLGRYTIRKN